jgi:hypothetical protein
MAHLGPSGMRAWIKGNLLTHFPQPSEHDTHHEHPVIAGHGNGSEQGAIPKGSQ